MEYEPIARRRLVSILLLVGLLVVALFAGTFLGLDANLILRRFAAHRNTNAAEQVLCDASPDFPGCEPSAASQDTADPTGGPAFVVPALAPTFIPSLTPTRTPTLTPSRSPVTAPRRSPTRVLGTVPTPGSATPTTAQVVVPTSQPIPTDVPCSGDINGYVLTNDGTILPGVNVMLTGAGYSNTIATDSDGFYEFSDLPAGTYTLSAAPAAASGFAAPLALTFPVTNCAFVGQDLTLIGAASLTPTASATVFTTAASTPTSTRAATATLTPTATRTSSPSSTTTVTRTATPAPSATPTGSPAPGTTTASFVATADSYVSAANPSTNYGASTSLRTDGSPLINSYLRFSVSGVIGTVKKATLRVYANSSSSGGYAARSVNTATWGESTITYGNAPAFSSTALGSTASFGAGVWTTVDITSYITGNGAFSLALTSTGAQINFASRESGANAPQLVITYGP